MVTQFSETRSTHTHTHPHPSCFFNFSPENSDKQLQKTHTLLKQIIFCLFKNFLLFFIFIFFKFFRAIFLVVNFFLIFFKFISHLFPTFSIFFRHFLLAWNFFSNCLQIFFQPFLGPLAQTFLMFSNFLKLSQLYQTFSNFILE